MKKLFLFFITVALIAAFSVPAVAGDDDTFSIRGQYRMEYYDKENYTDGDSSDNADLQRFFDQRLRTQFTFTPAEGVAAIVRMDWSEAQWGQGFTNSDWTRGNEGTSTLQVDRAYVKITKEMFKLQVGQQWIGVGNAIVLDSNATGIVPTLIFNPVAVKLIYIKKDEGGSLNDEYQGGDIDTFGLEVSAKTEAFSAGGYYIQQNEHASLDIAEDPNVIGLYGGFSLGTINLKAELDFFGGDCGTASFTGTQLYLNAQLNVSETVLGGIDFFYAASDDSADTVKQWISQTGSFDPLMYGPMQYIAGSGVNVFDPSGQEAGVIGLQLYGKIKAAEPVTVQASLAYLTPEDDGVTNLDDAMVINLAATYTFAPKTSFSLHYHHLAASFDTAAIADDAATALMGLLKVSF